MPLSSSTDRQCKEFAVDRLQATSRMTVSIFSATDRVFNEDIGGVEVYPRAKCKFVKAGGQLYSPGGWWLRMVEDGCLREEVWTGKKGRGRKRKE